jgi:hypothetical protein
VPNLFGRGAVEDGRTYSVALITAHTGRIPPDSSLIVQGVFYANFGQMMILEDEQEKGQYMMCAMSPDEFEDANYYYHKGDRVRVMGDYHEESGMDLGLGFGLARVLRNCIVSDPREKVVRPLQVEPATRQSPNVPEPDAPSQSASPPEPDAARSPARSDGQIELDVLHALDASKTMKSEGISVDTRTGEVTLSGSVSCESARELAELISGGVPGVTKVRNNLKVVTIAKPQRASP